MTLKVYILHVQQIGDGLGHSFTWNFQNFPIQRVGVDGLSSLAGDRVSINPQLSECEWGFPPLANEVRSRWLVGAEPAETS